MTPSDIKITVLYNNFLTDQNLTSAWGMSCLLEGMEKVILFDTGGDGHTLLSNMKKLGKVPLNVEVVVLSHIHGDHTGGLAEFLITASDVEVYMPRSFPSKFQRLAEKLGAHATRVGEPKQIFKDVYLTGELGDSIPEQALIIMTPKGSIIITGCAHPGVVDIVARAKDVCPGEVYLVTGGFHLMASSDQEI